MTYTQRENEKIKKELLEILKNSGRRMTAREIADMTGYTQNKTNAILTRLALDDYVNKKPGVGLSDPPEYEYNYSVDLKTDNDEYDYGSLELEKTANDSYTITVHGTSEQGENICFDNNILIHIDYGNCFYYDGEELVVLKLKEISESYSTDSFNMDLNDTVNGHNGKLKISKVMTFDNDVDLNKVDIQEMLIKGLSDCEVSDYEGHCMVIKDNPSLKIGFFYVETNIFEMDIRNYVAYILTTKHIYNLSASFSTSDHSTNETFLIEFLSKISLKDYIEGVQNTNDTESIRTDAGISLDDETEMTLKYESKRIFFILKKISDNIANIDIQEEDMEEAIERLFSGISEIKEVKLSKVSYLYNCLFANSFQLIFDSVYFIRNEIDYENSFGYNDPLAYVIGTNLYNNGVFEIDTLKTNIKQAIDSVNEEDIYKSLKEQIINSIKNGYSFVSRITYDYVEKMLQKKGDVFEAQGTQYEGRNERIENINIGDELTLKREPDNEHDYNTIELDSKNGNVGYLPWDATSLLAPAIDSGALKAVGKVVEVIPLSKRSKKAKKALLKVKIIINGQAKDDKEQSITIKNGNENIDKTNREKELKKEGAQKIDKDVLIARKNYIDRYKEIERNWKHTLDKCQSEISKAVFMSPYDVQQLMNLIISYRDKNGALYDALIEEIDDMGKSYIALGCSYEGVGYIKELIDEIFEYSSAFDLDFGTTGMEYSNIGNSRFQLSSSSRRIQSWWEKKYRLMSGEHFKDEEKNVTNERVAKHDMLIKKYEEEKRGIPRLLELRASKINEINNEIDSAMNKDLSDIEQSFKSPKLELDGQISDLEYEISRRRVEMSSLGFFNQKRKSILSSEIQHYTILLNQKAEERSNLCGNLELSINKKREEYEIERNKQIKEIENEIPLPVHPDKTIHRLSLGCCMKLDTILGFNWKKYGLDISVVHNCISTHCVSEQRPDDYSANLVISPEIEWRMLPKDRMLFLADFKQYLTTNIMASFEPGDYLTFVLDTAAFDGVYVYYSDGNRETEEYVITDIEPETYFGKYKDEDAVLKMLFVEDKKGLIRLNHMTRRFLKEIDDCFDDW